MGQTTQSVYFATVNTTHHLCNNTGMSRNALQAQTLMYTHLMLTWPTSELILVTTYTLELCAWNYVII